MIELVLTLNDRSGKYAQHAGVVLASIFANARETMNVHILYDETVSEDDRAKLTRLARSFHHYIFFYHVTVPEDMHEAASKVEKIGYWTKASMYRLLLPYIVRADRVIYLDCDVWVNMNIRELWDVELGECYLGAVLDQGKDSLGDYFRTMGLRGDIYFNSGVILFHLENIRKRTTWYEEMLHLMHNYPMMTMPDQDILNFLYSSNYMQLEQRFNTFAHQGVDLNNKIVHFAGENKWWDDRSSAAPFYRSFLAMTPWAETMSAAAWWPAGTKTCCGAVQRPVIAPPQPAVVLTQPAGCPPQPIAVPTQPVNVVAPAFPVLQAPPVSLPPLVPPLQPIPSTGLLHIPAAAAKQKRAKWRKQRSKTKQRKRGAECRKHGSIRKVRRSRSHAWKKKMPLSPLIRKKKVCIVEKFYATKSTRHLAVSK